MKTIQINSTTAIPAHELEFRFSRSAGPGGQNLNKLSTRVELLFDLAHSDALNDAQKLRIARALKARVGRDGLLRITAQESRSQWRNREDALEKFASLLRQALVKRKTRIPTLPSIASRERKALAKRVQSKKKTLRRRIDASNGA